MKREDESSLWATAVVETSCFDSNANTAAYSVPKSLLLPISVARPTDLLTDVQHARDVYLMGSLQPSWICTSYNSYSLGFPNTLVSIHFSN